MTDALNRARARPTDVGLHRATVARQEARDRVSGDKQLLRSIIVAFKHHDSGKLNEILTIFTIRLEITIN